MITETKITVEEYESGNGRNRVAYVLVNGETVASYHVRDVGRGYRKQAEAEAERLRAANCCAISADRAQAVRS